MDADPFLRRSGPLSRGFDFFTVLSTSEVVVQTLTWEFAAQSFISTFNVNLPWNKCNKCPFVPWQTLYCRFVNQNESWLCGFRLNKFNSIYNNVGNITYIKVVLTKLITHLTLLLCILFYNDHIFKMKKKKHQKIYLICAIILIRGLMR